MLPEHLKIGYEVVRVSTGTKDFELQGEFDAAHGTIIVNAEGTPRRRMAILMHEILHACVDQAELSDKLDDALEEQVVNRLAAVLTAVLLDNPQLRQAIETAARADNGTCYRWTETWVRTPGTFTPDEMAALRREEAIEKKKIEQGLNTNLWPSVDKPDNERFNEQKPSMNIRKATCLYPHCGCKTMC